MSSYIPRPLVAGINVTVTDGVAILPDGGTVDLVWIQALINEAFQRLGDQYFVNASDELSRLTGVYQGPFGDFTVNEVDIEKVTSQVIEDVLWLDDGFVHGLLSKLIRDLPEDELRKMHRELVRTPKEN